MAQQNSQLGLDIPDDEIGVVRDLRKKKPFNIRSLAIAVFVVVLVISSFWISFFLGKMLLTPVKKLPDIDFQKLDERFSEERIQLGAVSSEAVVTQEALPVYETSSARAVEDKEPVKTDQKEEKRQDPFSPQKKTEEKPRSKPVAPKKAVSSSKVFRVRSSVFDSREKAAELVAKLTDSGFESFVKEESSGRFSVQAGVFKSRSNAERLVQQLRDKGFEGEIID